MPAAPFVLKDYLQQQQQLIESYLEQYYATVSVAPKLQQAMTYSLQAGGKRLRPILATAAYSCAGGQNVTEVLPFAAALESIHTYSLIHDDLPAMDNDDLRRGKPTNHKVYGEATAILAGDALLTESFQMMASAPSSITDSQRLLIMTRVAHASGGHGMVGGQQLDMEHEATQPSLEILQTIHTHKTGRLLTVAVEVGALAAGCSLDEMTPYTDYGYHLGFAFQIVDDILDHTGQVVGKTPHSDLKSQKVTFVSLLGVEKSQQYAEQEINKAKQAVKTLHHKDTTILLALADYVIARLKL